MIAKLIEFSIRNRFLVLILTLMLIVGSIWAARQIRLDAIPDLSDVQVIVMTDYPGQNPQVVDDQVTYPLASAMLSVPGSKVVRGYSMFGLSFVYVRFDDGTDIYWARSRVLEYLNFARDRLPPGIQPKLGPDATGVGWFISMCFIPAITRRITRRGFGTIHQETSGMRRAMMRRQIGVTGWSWFGRSRNPAIARSPARRLYQPIKTSRNFGRFRIGICATR